MGARMKEIRTSFHKELRVLFEEEKKASKAGFFN
jgi:hypothetical protein